jgi:hypothetical protein
MNQHTKTTLKSLLLVLGFFVSIQALAVWFAPTTTPLGGAVASPLNVGANSQIKSGALVSGGGFRSMGLAIFDRNVEIGGNIVVGPSTEGGRENTNSAAIQLNSTTQGFLPPRMTKAERDAIVSPAIGLMVYQTDDTPGIRVYNGTWVRLLTEEDGVLSGR